MGLIQHGCGNSFLVFFLIGRRIYDLRDQTNIHPHTKQPDEILTEGTTTMLFSLLQLLAVHRLCGYVVTHRI